MDRSTLDKETQLIITNIVSKEKREVSELDAAFLRARIDYLTDDEKKRFADLLEEPVSNHALSKVKTFDKMNLSELTEEAVAIGISEEALIGLSKKEIIVQIEEKNKN